MREFRKVFPQKHKFIERNGIEVVIVLDTPSESDELLDFISHYPSVNWRVVMNEKPHSCRNPAKPLNVGTSGTTGNNCQCNGNNCQCGGNNCNCTF